MTLTSHSFLVLGGYGAVGAATVAYLRERGHSAVVAGRDPARADLVVDLRAGFAAAAQGVDVVINASGLEDAALASGLQVPLVDVSATAAYLESLRALGGRAVTGVGIAPGITNALAHEVFAADPGPIDLAVVLGAGEAHGAAAVDWTMGLVGTSFTDPTTGGPVRNFSRGGLFDLPTGRRRLVRADFADQHELTRQLGVPVATSFGLDSRFATAALAAVSRIPGGAAIARRVHPAGSDAWLGAARGPSLQLHVSGAGQSRATGRIAAETAIRSLDIPGHSSMRELIAVDELAAIVDGEFATRRL